MLKYFLFLCLFSKLNFATLYPPTDPYSGDPNQNYLYDQACYQRASEHSIRYENPRVRSKMIHSFYTKCLASVWPRCVVVNAKGLVVASVPYNTFKVNDLIIRDVDGKPVKKARRSGFLAERLLDPNDRWLIFWNASKPKTDVEKFRKIKFANIQNLHNNHFKNLASYIKKFQNAGIVNSSDKLYIMGKLPNGKSYRLMDAQKLETIVMSCLISIERSGESPELAKGDIDGLKSLLNKHLPTDLITIHLVSKFRLGERLHSFYPLFTLIKPDFPAVIHYMPFEMMPIHWPYHPTGISFIAALFDEEGNFVRDHRKDFASYLMITFDSSLSI